MSYLLSQEWLPLLLAALAGAIATWLWMVRKVDGQIPHSTNRTTDTHSKVDTKSAAKIGAAGAAGAAALGGSATTVTGGFRDTGTPSVGPSAPPPIDVSGVSHDSDSTQTVTGATDVSDITMSSTKIGAAESSGAVRSAEVVGSTGQTDSSGPVTSSTDAVKSAGPAASIEAAESGVIESEALLNNEPSSFLDKVTGKAAGVAAAGAAGVAGLGAVAGAAAGKARDAAGTVADSAKATAGSATGSMKEVIGAGPPAGSVSIPAGFVQSKFGIGSVDATPDGAIPEGFPIKGNSDSMLFHTEESPGYKQTRAEVWFDTETRAEAAGFRHWDIKRRQSGGRHA